MPYFVVQAPKERTVTPVGGMAVLAAALSGQPPPPCRAAVDYVRPPCGHRCQLPCHTRAALADWTPTPVVDAEGVVHEGTAAPAKPPVPLPMPTLRRVGVRPAPCPENQQGGFHRDIWGQQNHRETDGQTGRRRWWLAPG